MKALIYYIDFHWDNYQGGSGKSFELVHCVDLKYELTMNDFWEFIHKTIQDRIKTERPFQQTNRYSIQRVEIL